MTHCGLPSSSVDDKKAVSLLKAVMDNDESPLRWVTRMGVDAPTLFCSAHTIWLVVCSVVVLGVLTLAWSKVRKLLS